MQIPDSICELYLATEDALCSPRISCHYAIASLVGTVNGNYAVSERRVFHDVQRPSKLRGTRVAAYCEHE